VSFRKKHREAQEKGEDVKVVRAKDSQQDKEQAKEPAADQATEQTTGQQSGQEAGQPPDQDQQGSDEQQSSEEDDKDDDAEPVPDGTTAEILRWVGDDPERAQRALDKEQADDRPRTGLTGELNKILEQ
jgi:hypothetical protein